MTYRSNRYGTLAGMPNSQRWEPCPLRSSVRDAILGNISNIIYRYNRYGTCTEQGCPTRKHESPALCPGGHPSPQWSNMSFHLKAGRRHKKYKNTNIKITSGGWSCAIYLTLLWEAYEVGFDFVTITIIISITPTQILKLRTLVKALLIWSLTLFKFNFVLTLKNFKD